MRHWHRLGIVMALALVATMVPTTDVSREPSVAAEAALPWKRTGGPLGGLGYDVRMMPDRPDVMLVSDAFAGVFRSTNGGVLWSPANTGINTFVGPTDDEIPIFSITIDPNDHNIVWAGTQESRGIYRSADGGLTWTQRDNGVTEINGITFRGFTVEPGDSDVVYAAAELSSHAWNNGIPVPGEHFDRTKGVVYKTLDGGANLFPITPVGYLDNLARYVWIDPTDTDTLYLSTGIFDREAANSDHTLDSPGGVGVLKSTDGGASWFAINNGLDNLYVGSLFMHPQEPETLLAGTGNNTFDDDRGAYLSIDGGVSWSQTLSGYSITSVEFALSDPSVAYAGGSEAVFRSDDGGWTWAKRTLPAQSWGPPGLRAGFPIDFMVHPNNPDVIHVNAYGGGNFVSDDGGHTWEVASAGYTGAEMRDLAVDPTAPGLVFSVGRSGVFLSGDGGDTWHARSAPDFTVLEWHAVAIDPNDRLHALAATNWNSLTGGGHLMQTYDGGATWDTVDFQLPFDTGFSDIEFAPAEPGRVYAATAGFRSAGSFDLDQPAAGIYRSDDGGVSWSLANDSTSRGAHVTDLAVASSFPGLVYAATTTGLLRSNDGGGSWTKLSGGLPNQPITMVAMHPTDPGTLFAGAHLGGLYRTLDGGASWPQVTKGITANTWMTDLVFDPTDPDVLFVADRIGGVFMSTDGGEEWIDHHDGLRNKSIWALAISGDGHHVYAATKGEGVYRLDRVPDAPPSVPIPTNGAPTAVDDSATVTAGGTVLVSVSSNDSDPEGDALTPAALRHPSQGTLQIVGNGFTYTHTGGTITSPTTDSFTYLTFDEHGAHSDTAVVRITVTPPPDTTDPTVTITTPGSGATFARNQVVAASYICADETGGSGLASCVGTVANGAAIDTATAGAKTFTVTATDNAANTKAVTHNYTVTAVPDTTDPTATIITPPNGASYTAGDSVAAAYSCADTGGSGLASCVGTVATGVAIDTATAGAKTFSVTATDNAGNTTTVTHSYSVTAVLPKVLTPDTVGVVNIDNAQWYLTNSAGAVTNFEYGNPGDLPISGDWDGNPTSTPGLYRSEDSGGLPGGFFYARNSNSTGIANDACFGGNPSDVPVSGDWDGDGDDTLGIMRLVGAVNGVGGQPTFFLFDNSCVGTAPQSDPFANALGAAQTSFEFGDAGDTPVVGDWDGDGKDEIGLYRRSNGFFYNRETLSTGIAHNACFAGDPSDYPIGGDWDGDGDGNLGIYRPSVQRFFLFTTSCMGLAPPSTPFANAMGAAQIEVPLVVAGADVTKLRPVSGAFGLG